MFLSGAERQKALKALRKRLGITGEMPGTVGEINALPVGTFLLKHGNSLSNFVPAEKPIGFLRVDNAEKGWIVGVLGSGGGFRGPVDPSGILEVVPLTPTLLASMVDVGSRRTAHIPLPRSAGYGKADRKAWAYWVGAEILNDGSEARQALKDAIETMVGSEVKIGDITWSPGQNIHVEFEEPGKKPRSMGFLKNGNAGAATAIKLTKKQHAALSHILTAEEVGVAHWQTGKNDKHGTYKAHLYIVKKGKSGYHGYAPRDTARSTLDGLIKKKLIKATNGSMSGDGAYWQVGQHAKPGTYTKPYKPGQKWVYQLVLKSLPGAGAALAAPIKSVKKKAHKALTSPAWQAYEAHQKAPKSVADAGVVRVKVVGGTTTTPLFVGHDSKGRAKYELIPPKGQQAASVASMLRTSAKKGEKLFGGDVYVIRVSVGGKEYDYYKAK
jgi:hypothetical protein